MNVLCIIPARSGSKRLPGKNWEKVGGRMLIERAAECVPIGSEIVFATDAPERIGNGHYKAMPKELAQDNVPMHAVVDWAEQQATRRYSCVLLLQPTSPFRTHQDVLECLRILDASQCDSVISVSMNLIDKSYRRNGAIYLERHRSIRQRRDAFPHFGGWTQFYVMPTERSIDINTAEDLAEARRLAGDS